MRVLASLHRVFVPSQQAQATVEFYQALLGQPAARRFTYAAAGLELAMVGPMLIIAGPEEALEPFRATAVTYLVDDLAAFARCLPQLGAQVLEPPKEVPTGWNLRARHPDGLLVEYVQHRAPGQGAPPGETP